MIKNILKLSFLMLLGTLFSCQKYESGPTISLKSKNERLANVWVIENYKKNGEDLTSLVSEYTETFSEQNAYQYTWGFFNGRGSWAFQNDSKEVKLSGDDEQSMRTLIILKLEDKSLWYKYTSDEDEYEIHLIPQ